MESNEQTELSKIQTDSERAGWQLWRVGFVGGGIEQKEKGLMDMDHSVVIAGGKGI